MERSPSNPENLPTTTSGSRPAHTPWPIEEVDIIVHSLLSDGSIRHRATLTSREDLRAFLHNSSHSAPAGSYLLSITDISTELAQDLTECLNIYPDVFKKYTLGQLNSASGRHIKSELHSERLVSTLLDRPSARQNNYSLTWWKLSTHSLSQYSSEIQALTESNADPTKIVVPHFNIHISDTRRTIASGEDQVSQVKSGLNELLRQWKRTKDEAENVTQREQTVETIYTLCSNTYRAHQVISEVKNNYWGSASEERITHIKARIHDASFYIFLFDRERMFHKQRQIFETEYINSGSRGVLHKIFGRAASVPISRLIKADDRVLIGTFLTNFNGELSPPVLMPQRTRFGPNLVAETATLAGAASHCSFGDSTRQQFLGHLSNLGPLVHPEREENDALPLLQIHLTFAKIMARDWDLVLSQMGQTLDDIDRKISDNTELRENVLSWRRLLGSWRMIIIEYKAKLAETHQFLKSQTSHKHTAVYNIPFPGETSQRHTPDSITNPFNVGSTEYEVDDIIFSYEILEDAIKVIEGRVDKSFQALMSSMSILESQKAITQGSAVARLTELAFIFIPLNLASTFFSMQIKEFQGNSAPTIGAFFALAVPLMLFLYTLRGFIRSSLLKSIRHHLDSKIRETSKIPGTSEIPTRVIVSFGWRQLGSFSRALLIVVPLAMVLLSLIIRFGQWLPFRILGAVVTIIGTAIITLLLAIESYVPALQVGVIIGWVLSMLGIGLGRLLPLNPSVMAALCTLVTTIFFTALGFIPQKITDHPQRRLAQVLLPLWLVELPVAIICHSYSIHTPRWELWILLFAIFSVFVIFGIVVEFSSLSKAYYGSLPQYTAIAAFSIGYPMALVWSYAPQHGRHLPLYGAIIVTFASIAIFFHLIDSFADGNWNTSIETPLFFMLLCAMVALPITLVWETLPAHHIVLRPWVQINVTCGSVFVFAISTALVPPFSRTMWDVAALLLWGSTAAWLPALLWAGKTEAFKGLTQSRIKTIHVTWTWVLFWTVLWALVSIPWNRRAELANSRYLRRKYPHLYTHPQPGPISQAVIGLIPITSPPATFDPQLVPSLHTVVQHPPRLQTSGG